MTPQEIQDRMETCPWRERPIGDPYYICTRFLGNTVVLCDGACSWVTDYHKSKEGQQPLVDVSCFKNDKVCD